MADSNMKSFFLDYFSETSWASFSCLLQKTINLSKWHTFLHRWRSVPYNDKIFGLCSVFRNLLFPYFVCLLHFLIILDPLFRSIRWGAVVLLDIILFRWTGWITNMFTYCVWNCMRVVQKVSGFWLVYTQNYRSPRL